MFATSVGGFGSTVSFCLKVKLKSKGWNSALVSVGFASSFSSVGRSASVVVVDSDCKSSKDWVDVVWTKASNAALLSGAADVCCALLAVE